MTHDQYAIDQANENAPRMAHMSDADIRAAIAAEVAGLSGSMGYGVGIGAMDSEGHARVRIGLYRAELVRRACAKFNLPMMTSLQMLTLKHVAERREQKPAFFPLFDEMVGFGLMANGDKYRLTPLARDFLEASSEKATNLPEAMNEAKAKEVNASALAGQTAVLTSAIMQSGHLVGAVDRALAAAE